MASSLEDWIAAYFLDRVDPEDPNYRLVEIRLPHAAKAQPSYGPFSYAGLRARERLRRFCAGFLSGFGDITVHEAEKIMRKSRAAEERFPSS
jgi:hypothetical protein